MVTPHLSASLQHVLEAATLAPSVHNTQPWRFALRADGFDLLADESRRLTVLDPTGRLLHVSCGTALVHARVAARALGLSADVELLPEPGDPSLLARVTLSAGAAPDDDELALALAVLKRHTVRDAFAPEPLPEGLLHALGRAAEQEGAALRPLHDEGERVSLAVLLSGADWSEERDPAYRRELASWVRDAPAQDGISPEALPADVTRGSSLRQRDFALTHPERSGGEAPPAEEPAVVVLTTPRDGPRAWLEAGQALGSVLLHAAQHGVQAQPLAQVVDLPGPRAQLAKALGLTGTPQMVLRLGYATARAATGRRDVTDVLTS
ncbi:MAG: hypothetical protein JWM62_1132 [Frankiales bacterium]|nr:hypothetical protein [Frankiales bacterium]